MMLNKIIRRIHFYRCINFFQYLYLNYFCKSIVRTDNSRIIPYKNVVLDLSKNAQIIVGKGDIELGCDLLKKSKAETRVRLRDRAVWSNLGGCKISYGCTLEILHDGILDTNYFTMNSNSTIVASNRITIERDVMISRNVLIYDSDFHSILDCDGIVKNPSEPVTIKEHVWVGANVIILKGVTIGSNTVIGADSSVFANVEDNVIYKTGKNVIKNTNYGIWNRIIPD